MAIKHIVFDSNTWITYFYNNQFTELVELKTDKELSIYTCSRQLQEIAAVLKRTKFKQRFSNPTSQYIHFCKLIALEIEIDERYDGSADSKDNYLVDTAYTAKADYIISSDKHLLNLKHVGTIQIISLSDFKKKLQLDY